MKIEFDPAKSEKNARERGLPFDLVDEFDFDSALIVVDDRRNYDETRYRAIGRLGDEAVCGCFHDAWRCGEGYLSASREPEGACGI